jgi:hypothetical protein
MRRRNAEGTAVGPFTSLAVTFDPCNPNEMSRDVSEYRRCHRAQVAQRRRPDTPGGAAEAEARIRTYSKMGGTIISIEADEAGQFLSTARAAATISRLDEVDPGWGEAAPFHVETDPIRSNTPPPAGVSQARRR